jgi:hypothetical protein
VTIFGAAARDEGEYHDGGVTHDLLSGLREWQKEAFTEYFRQPRRDFLLVATPGAGKTAWALTVAAQLLARREVAAITVVTPTEHPDPRAHRDDPPLGRPGPVRWTRRRPVSA